MGGGGLIVNIFFGVEYFSSGVVIFSGGLRNFRGGGEKICFVFFLGGGKKFLEERLKKILGGGVEKFWGVWGWIKKFSGWVEKFSAGLRNFRGAGLRIFDGRVEKFSGGGLRNFRGGENVSGGAGRGEKF